MDWYDKIAFFKTEKFGEITSFLDGEVDNGVQILPSFDKILNAYVYTPLEEVKVVILGQDPYPTPGHAHGLAFSVEPNVSPLPKSLQNIYKELCNDIGCNMPKNGSLIPWAKQGVLLLNTSLTVESGKPNSHSDIGWDKLVNETIEIIDREMENVVFILWGAKAQQKSFFIRNNHLIINSSHPSPLSAYRGFFGSKPFSQTNEYLEKNNKQKIDWSLNEV